MSSTTVKTSDLKHLLDVYIENGMVEDEDEAIINRLWDAIYQSVEDQLPKVRKSQPSIATRVVDSEGFEVDLGLFTPGFDIPATVQSFRLDGDVMTITYRYLHDEG